MICAFESTPPSFTQMSHTCKAFNVLILFIDWQSKSNEGTRPETWKALFLVTQKLAAIKEASKRKPADIIPFPDQSMENSSVEQYISNTIIHEKTFTDNARSESQVQHALSISMEELEARISKIAIGQNENHEKGAIQKSLFEALPTELIIQILSHLDQENLASLSITSKRFCRLATPQLYSNPYLTSPGSIHRFLSSLKTKNSHSSFVTKIIFAPTKIGSLADPTVANSKFDLIPDVHSGLFKILINTRSNPEPEMSLVHSIFYEFAKYASNCFSLEEYGCHKENRQFLAERDLNGKNVVSKIPSSNVVLSFLHRSCQRWFNEFPEWDGLKNSLFECYQTVLLLLQWLQGDFHPIWHRVGSSVVRSVKGLIINKCKSFLSHLNSSLLLQVRFITGNSQRLLDCYCLIYYRVLALAQSLDVQKLSEAMQKTPIQKKEENKVDSDLNSSLTINQKAARSIYEALTIIFHFRIPSELFTPNQIPEVPVELMQNILLTFPPSSINSETAELIGRILEVDLDNQDATSPMLQKWTRWLREIILWHEASIEMEPVKDLLRKSMAKIDSLRTIQRRYGVNFME